MTSKQTFQHLMLEFTPIIENSVIVTIDIIVLLLFWDYRRLFSNPNPLNKKVKDFLFEMT